MYKTILYLTLFLLATTAVLAYSDCSEVPSVVLNGKNCVNVNNCTNLESADTYYLLVQNVSSDNSCFFLSQDNVTLDLNGYTATYAVNGNVQPCWPRSYEDNFCHFGVYGWRAWDITPDVPYTSNNAGHYFTIKNGVLRQAKVASTAKQSNAIYIRGNYMTVYNMTIITEGDNSEPIVCLQADAGYACGHWNISFNRFESHGSLIDPGDRYNTPAMIKYPLGYADIHDNQLLYGPQIGINLGRGSYNRVYNNYIAINQTADNAYGIRCSFCDYSEFYNNTIMPYNGRGILIEPGDYNKFYDNTIVVKESMTSGTYAFRFRNVDSYPGSHYNEVYNNNITAIAGYSTSPGPAVGLDMGVNGDDLYNNIHDNHIRAVTLDPAYKAMTILTEGSRTYQQGDNTIRNNIISGNHYLIATDYIEANGAVGSDYLYDSNTFIKEPGNPEFYLMKLYADNPDELAVNEILLNSTLLGGASFADIVFQPSAYYHGCSSTLPCNYTIQWYLNVHVQDGESNPLGNADVEIRNAWGGLITASTDAEGNIPTTALTEFTNSSNEGTVMYSPYNVSVTYEGETISRLVDMDRSRAETFTIEVGPCTEGATRQCGTTDTGTCAYGTQTCSAGVWGVCTGAIGSATEVCDSTLDEDCDGATDCDDSDCASFPACIPPCEESMDITLTADDQFDLYVNGNLIGSDNAVDGWMSAETFTVPLADGENVIAVQGNNAGSYSGVLLEADYCGEKIYSDNSWRGSPTLQTGWNDVGFDDGSWSQVTDFGSYGVAPWNTNVVGFPNPSPALWIWDTSGQATAYLRYDFQVSTGGTSGGCALPYDTIAPCDCVNSNELIDAIDAWYEGQLGISALLEHITTWKQCSD